MGYMVGILLKAIEVGDLEERVKSLEDRLKVPKSKKKDASLVKRVRDLEAAMPADEPDLKIVSKAYDPEQAAAEEHEKTTARPKARPLKVN